MLPPASPDECRVLDEFERLLVETRPSGSSTLAEAEAEQSPDAEQRTTPCPDDDWEHTIEAVLGQLQQTGVAEKLPLGVGDEDAHRPADSSARAESTEQREDERADAELDAALTQFVTELGAVPGPTAAGTGGKPSTSNGTGASEANYAAGNEVESLISNLVQTILSKDVLYAPMLEIRGLYEYYLNKEECTAGTDGEAHLAQADLERYQAQYTCVNEIITCLEDESLSPGKQTEMLMDLIARMESMGDPPPGVLETMNVARERQSHEAALDQSRTDNNADPEQVMAILEKLLQEVAESPSDASAMAKLQRAFQDAPPTSSDCRQQ
jgi:hypothetical protein